MTKNHSISFLIPEQGGTAIATFLSPLLKGLIKLFFLEDDGLFVYKI